MTEPDCTVVIPTRDRIPWLRITLRSVLEQRDVDLEVIVVDDGSTQDTAATVAPFGDARVRTIRHETSQGVSRSRNHGAAEARGTWLGFVDDDDVWAPDKMARQVAEATAIGAAWAYAGCVNVDARLRVVAARRPPPPDVVVGTIGRANVIPGGGSNVIVRREAFERVGPFDPRHRNTEDWDLWIRLASIGPPACVDEPLLGYRVHGRNASLDVAAILAGADLIEQTYHAPVDRAVLHRWIAESALRIGRRADALRHFAVAAGTGQAANVARDLSAIVRRRLARSDDRGDEREAAGDEWSSRAEPWLATLRM